MKKNIWERYPTISMKKFLINYAGVYDTEILECLLTLHHRDVREVFKIKCGFSLKCVPFDNISLEELETGEILIVEDAFSCKAPYVNPKAYLYDTFHSFMLDANDAEYLRKGRCKRRGEKKNEKYKRR